VNYSSTRLYSKYTKRKNMTNSLLPISIGVAAFSLLVGLIILLAKYSKKMKAKVAEVASMLGANFDPGDWKTQPSMHGTLDRRDYILTFHVVSTGKSNVTYLDLKTPVTTHILKLAVRKATGAGKFFKKLGLNNPLSSGDPYFDEKVAVKGEPEQDVLSILYGGYFKEPAIQLTQRGFVVDLKDGDIVASKIYNFKKDMDEIVIRGDLANLITLAKSMEKR